MFDGGEDLDADAEEDEGDTDAEGESGVVVGGGLFDGGDFSEEESEAGDDESEAHHGESGADPGEEGAFGGEEGGGVGAVVGDFFGHGSYRRSDGGGWGLKKT